MPFGVTLAPIDTNRRRIDISLPVVETGQARHLPQLGDSMRPRSSSSEEPYEPFKDLPEDAEEETAAVADGSSQGPHEAEVAEGTKCEFAGPCRMGPSPDGMHFRKVISHIFGRNKTSTKLFPSWVWTHYCRKHYQRARYRADQWPFTQCELLLESLSRMETWGGVRSFQVVLRRREAERVSNTTATPSQTPGCAPLLPTGRRHPTAIISPVPNWLRPHLNIEMTFDNIRGLVLRIRNYMAQLREEERAQQTAASGHGKNTAGEQTQVRQQASRVRFPDVEILPSFQQWVIDAALLQRNRQGAAVEDAAVEDAAGEDVDDQDADGQDNEGQNTDDNDGENVKEEGETDDAPTPPAREIGRTGTNSGRSASQRRRSARNFTNQVSGRNGSRLNKKGAVQKPNSRKKKK